MYASGTAQWARLAAVATDQALTSAGVGVAPVWSDYLHGFAKGLLAGGVPFVFGGNSAHGWSHIAYLIGFNYDTLAPNTGILSVLNTDYPGTLKLEAMLAVTGGATVTLGMMNMTDASDTPMTNSEITSTSATGARIQSGVITLAAGTKVYGVKGKVSSAAQQGYAWSIRLLRTT